MSVLAFLIFNPFDAQASGQRKIQITIDHTKVAADLTNFPVYVNLANLTSNFWAWTSSGCGDIRVTSSDGTTEVPREVVTCDKTAKTGELWFKASSLSSSNDTTFYIYYGGIQTDYATNATYGAQNVWDSNYKGVWHLKDGTTLSGSDSTSNTNNGTSHGSPSATSGQLDGAGNFSGSSDNLGITAISVNGVSYTISAWFNTPLPNSTCSGYCTLTRGSNDHQVLVDPSHLLGTYNNACGY